MTDIACWWPTLAYLIVKIFESFLYLSSSKVRILFYSSFMNTNHIECLLYTRHSARGGMYIMSFNSQNNTRNQGLFLAPHIICEETEAQRLCYLKSWLAIKPDARLDGMEKSEVHMKWFVPLNYSTGKLKHIFRKQACKERYTTVPSIPQQRHKQARRIP